MHTFWGLYEVHWAAITGLATAGLVIVTGILAWVAWYQIGAARRDAKLNRTLAACDRYDLDPILDVCSRRLAKARDAGVLKKNLKALRLDIFSILNYIESIAIGIDQGLYDEKMVREYMEPIFKAHVEEFMSSGIMRKLEYGPDDFTKSVALCKKWKLKMPVPKI